MTRHSARILRSPLARVNPNWSPTCQLIQADDKVAELQDRNRTARSVWNAWSLLPLLNRPAPCDSASKLDALQTLRVAVHPQYHSQLASSFAYCRAASRFRLGCLITYSLFISCRVDSAIDGEGMELQAWPMSDEHRNVRLPLSEPHSKPWWLRAFAASVIGLLVGSVWLLMRQGPRVPVYRGKSLPVWLRTYGGSSPSSLHSREWIEADDAVRHLGTNCIPVLLRMIRE